MSKNNLSIILQRDQNPPKHFAIAPDVIKKLFFIFAILTAIAVANIMAFSVWFGVNKISFDEEKVALNNQIEELTESINSQQLKFEEQKAKLQKQVLQNDQRTFAPLDIINTLPSAEDLRSKGIVTIEKLEKNAVATSKLEYQFTIRNNSQDGRTRGHIFALFFDPISQQLSLYPKQARRAELPHFSNGEYFSVSNFRPTKVDFNIPTSQVKTIKKLLRIILFDAEGNLIHSEDFKVD